MKSVFAENVQLIQWIMDWGHGNYIESFNQQIFDVAKKRSQNHLH